MKQVSFIAMEQGTAADYAFLAEQEQQYIAGLPGRLTEALLKLQHSLPGYQLSVLEHSLQSATRAHRAGESEQLVVAALLHDIGDGLAPYSHSEMVAAILRPFVSEEIYWVIKHHGLFQQFYYAHHSGGNRHARDRYRDHRYYQSTVDFCHRYDQNCFDPDYAWEPLEFFRPMIEGVFAAPLNAIQT